MSKRIGNFNSRDKANAFRKKHRIPIKEIRRYDRDDGSKVYRLIVSDAVFKRWSYYLKNRLTREGQKDGSRQWDPARKDGSRIDHDRDRPPGQDR